MLKKEKSKRLNETLAYIFLTCVKASSCFISACFLLLKKFSSQTSESVIFNSKYNGIFKRKKLQNKNCHNFICFLNHYFFKNEKEEKKGLIFPLLAGYALKVKIIKIKQKIFWPFKHYWQQATAVLLLVCLVSGLFFWSNQPKARAASYSWIQTSWSGGLDGGVYPNHTDNQSNWTKYSSEDNNIATSTDLKLKATTATTSIDFTTEGDYTQEDAANGTDFTSGKAALNGYSATGGIITTLGRSTIHTFTSSGVFNFTSSGGNVEYLIVAGGGGGGYGYYGAGGGAGGLLYEDAYAVTTGEKNVVVGGGGAGSIYVDVRGSNGDNSSFDNNAASGGGAGGCGSTATAAANGADGGSGGGGNYLHSYGIGISGQGYNGGACVGAVVSGGGGGAGGDGAVGTGSWGASPGGDGLDYSAIFGTAYGDPAYPGWFAGGGGGAKWENHSNGGKGGGGIGGGMATVPSTAGAANTGGGGGGGRDNGNTDAYGKAGGSGIVMVKYLSYPVAQSYYITTTDTSQVNSSSWVSISGTSFTQTTPANTNIKYLVSFDDRATWKYWNGSSWAASSLDNLQTNGMSSTTLSSLTAVNWAASGGFQSGITATLDFAMDLSTTNTSVTSEIDQIMVNYINYPIGNYSTNAYTNAGDYVQEDGTNGTQFSSEGVKLHSIVHGTEKFGDGVDGACTISGTKNINTDTNVCDERTRGFADAVNFSVTQNTSLGQNQIILSSAPDGLSIGDEILIINLQGTSGNNLNVGLYETKAISSINSNTLTLSSILINSYNGTTQKIMVQRVPNYSNVTISGGAVLTASAWDGTKGGVLFFRASGALTNSGSINMTGKGYSGGAGGPTADGTQGESYGGAGIISHTPNIGGGSGGVFCNESTGAAGGSYGSQGGQGLQDANSPCGGSPTNPGLIYGEVTLNNRLYFGSGGGGGAQYYTYGVAANGGGGGGIILILADTLTVAGSIASNGVMGLSPINSPRRLKKRPSGRKLCTFLQWKNDLFRAKIRV